MAQKNNRIIGAQKAERIRKAAVETLCQVPVILRSGWRNWGKQEKCIVFSPDKCSNLVAPSYKAGILHTCLRH